MFTIKLIENSDDSLIYDIWNTDLNEFVNQISVNKHDYSYKLKNGIGMTNHYESAAYRSILEAIKANVAPKKYSNGWG